MENSKRPGQVTNSKPIPHIPLPFEEVMKDVLKVKPPAKMERKPDSGAKVPKR
jgi:hypothetical protein